MAFLAPAFAAITAGVKAFAATAIGGFLVNTALSIGFSLLAELLSPRSPEPGQKLDGTTAGDDAPQGFPLGRSVTGGHLEYQNSHTGAGGTPNGYLTLVFTVSDLPGVALRRVIAGDAYTDLGDTAHPDYGFPMLRYRRGSTDHGWIRFYNGHQSTADAMLIAKYGADPDQPWTANHVGTGLAYVIVTLRYNRDVFTSVPGFSFELDGIPLYDPRFDTTAGGAGPQRWNDLTTWQPSDNPAIQVYNVSRGIPVPGGDIWGAQVAADDLPLANVFASANACDTAIGDRPQFRHGRMVALADEPASVVESCLHAGLGQIAENGGVFRTLFGAPAPASFFFADADISISDPQTAEPYPGLQEAVNAVSVIYADPDQLWQARTAPTILRPALEAQDGGRRLLATLQLPGVFDGHQAQQIGNALLDDNRRFRKHQLVLPGDAQILEALESVAWTSVRNGYVNKAFEVVACTYLPGTMFVALTLRERDPADYSWSTAQELPLPPAFVQVVPPPRQVIGFAVAAHVVEDGGANPRRPALRLSWTAAQNDDIAALFWEVRLAGGAVVASGTSATANGAQIVVEGIVPGVAYEARARLNAAVETVWTPWTAATAPVTLITTPDVQPGAVSRQYVRRLFASTLNITANDIATAQQIIAPFDVSFLHSGSPVFAGPLLFTIFGRGASITSPSRLHFYIEYFNGSIWQAIDIGLPFHAAETSYGTRTHHFSYGFYSDAYSPVTFQQMRLRGFVGTPSPYNSNGYALDNLTLIAEQINR